MAGKSLNGRTPGHFAVHHGPGDWRCNCGVNLSGGPLGNGQRGARDVMRFHRMDLNLAKICSVEDCDRPSRVRGWCLKHYSRWQRHGDPTQFDGNVPGPCKVDGCGKPKTGHGFCVAHYKRWRRWGDPNIKRPIPDPVGRFWKRVEKTDTCWIWTAGKTKQGYGAFSPTKGNKQLVHRWAYETFIGPIPDGLVIDHLCRNRACVRPEHLEPVTNEENLRRGLGYALQNGMRTACVNGHPATPENRRLDRHGKTTCRECRREYDRRPERLSTLRKKAKVA